VHVIAEVRADRVVLRDAGSANRSTFEGRPLGETGDFAIDNRGTLTLGNEYNLEVAPFGSTLSGELEIQNERMWSGPPAQKPTVRGSVRFMPSNSEIALYNAVWVHTDATCGASKSNPVLLGTPGAAEVEGRFYHYRGNFWIESLPTGRGVSVDDYKLCERDLVPLVDGARLMIGAHHFNATVEL
jgi:hypothetical protein